MNIQQFNDRVSKRLTNTPKCHSSNDECYR